MKTFYFIGVLFIAAIYIFFKLLDRIKTLECRVAMYQSTFDNIKRRLDLQGAKILDLKNPRSIRDKYESLKDGAKNDNGI